MGRQKGEAARSKARPSSSSLAASLLPSGATAVGFGGYVGSSRLDAALATQEATPYMVPSLSLFYSQFLHSQFSLKFFL
ncbi:hypothetical protein LguiA_011909 [Lonicera macranthoides]